MAPLFSPPPCPKCTHSLRWRDLRTEFNCPSCSTRLRSNYWLAAITILILTTVFAVFVPEGVWSALITCVILIAGSMIVLASCTTVRTVRTPDAT
jgi:hypothetical protein